jgi:RNA polymerase sigma-70 factor (sigma-E family)
VNETDSEFTAYYVARGRTMRNTAYLLCGDWHLAEDLTQTAFAKLYRVWGRVQRRDALDAYVRRVLLRAFLDERRKPWRREHSVEPGSAVLDPAQETVGGHEVELREALAAVPPRQRAVLVLRFWADLSVEQTAEALGCSTGNVKSQTARGLATLREALDRQGVKSVRKAIYLKEVAP